MTLAQVVRKRGFSALLLCFHILAGRTYQLPTCPATKYAVDPQGLPKSTDRHCRRPCRPGRRLPGTRIWKPPGQRSNLAIMRLSGFRFKARKHLGTASRPMSTCHFLDAIRQALAASVASQDIEHFWCVYNLEWWTQPQGLRFSSGVLPLESLLAPPTILKPSAATPQAPSEVCCISS